MVIGGTTRDEKTDLLIRRKAGDTSAGASGRLLNGRMQKRMQNLKIVGVERNPDRRIGHATEMLTGDRQCYGDSRGSE